MVTERRSMRDRIREEAAKSTTEGAGYLNIPKGMKLYKSENGEDNELDVIPYENNKKDHFKGYEVGELLPYFRFKIHKGIGADDQKYVCPASFGKKCPICEAVKQMRNNKNGDPEIIKSLAAKDRFLMQIIDTKDKKNDSIQLWEESYHAFLKKLLADIDAAENSDNSRKRNRAHAGFAELDGGQTLVVDFLEKKGFKNFVEATRIDAFDREPYADSILDETSNLEDCLKVLSYDDLEAKFLEIEPEEQGANRKRDEKDDKEEAPSRSRGSRGKAEEAAPETSSRRRGAAKEEVPADEPPPTRRRGTAKEEPEPAKEEAPTSGRRRGATPTPDPEPETPPTRTRRGAVDTKADDRCYVPYGKFGVDTDNHVDEAPAPNCYDCPDETYQACKAAQTAANK